MKLSDYGPNTNVYELMTWLFPGVRFGEFHEKMDPKHFSETTGKCSADKTKYWIDIENKFQKYSSKPSDFLYFIEFLSEYKASGKDNIVFNQCFPHNGTKNSVFSNKILFDKLANPKEIEQLLKDCDILNGHTLKGGVFLYCARILDSKFLSYFYKKGTNTENIIYKLLKHFDSQIASNKPKFPVSSIFNESNSWRNDWEATYDNTEYRFGWQKYKDEHWQTLYEYKPDNPYQYFLHECQTRYTLVRIGLETIKSIPIKRAKEILCFANYASKGFKDLDKAVLYYDKIRKKEVKVELSKIKNLYVREGIKGKKGIKDKEGNILIGIETKVGAENFTPAFFIPKNLEETIKEIKYAVGHKKSEIKTQHTEYKLNPAEITKLNKIFSKLPQEAFNNLSPKETVALQKKQPYELLKILNKPDVQNFLSEDEKKFITESSLNAFYTEESFDTLINEESKDTLLDQTSIDESFEFLMDKFQAIASKKLNAKTVDAVIKSFNEEFFKDDNLGLKNDIASTDDEDILDYRNEYYNKLLNAIRSVNFTTSSSELSDNIFAKRYLELDANMPEKGKIQYKKQIRETIWDILLELGFFSILQGELLKKTSLGKEKVTKYIDEIWKDFKNASNKTSFITTLENDIINFNVNCSDEELSDNYFIKKFLNSEISLPNTTVHIMFREILNEIIKNW